MSFTNGTDAAIFGVLSWGSTIGVSDNIDIIDEIREKYDPLSELVRPHITIVFPFEMDITNEELSIIIENRFKNIESFVIEMQGFSKCENRFGNYLF